VRFRAIGLYSITEDYFEQDVNSVFCKNSEFIETGETLGLEKRLLVIRLPQLRDIRSEKEELNLDADKSKKRFTSSEN
jgi:hypothetical protein